MYYWYYISHTKLSHRVILHPTSVNIKKIALQCEWCEENHNMSRLDFISLNVRGYSTLLSLPLADLNVYKQKNPLLGGA